MKAYQITEGMKVKGEYYGKPYTGTVTGARWHTCRPDVTIIFVDLDNPIEGPGGKRDGIVIDALENGQDYSEYNDNFIEAY